MVDDVLKSKSVQSGRCVARPHFRCHQIEHFRGQPTGPPHPFKGLCVVQDHSHIPAPRGLNDLIGIFGHFAEM